MAAHPSIPPQMKASDNKFLKVKGDVVLTPLIEKVICLMDPFFGAHALYSYVTSGLRTAEHQLRLIKRFALEYQIEKEFPEIVQADLYRTNEKGYYQWQEAWNRVLQTGKLINPPLPADLIWSYFHPAQKKEIAAGTRINLSTHQQGRAFDIGGSGGSDHTIADELVVVNAVVASDKIPDIQSITPENINNAIHVTCRSTL